MKYLISFLLLFNYLLASPIINDYGSSNVDNYRALTNGEFHWYQSEGRDIFSFGDNDSITLHMTNGSYMPAGYNYWPTHHKPNSCTAPDGRYSQVRGFDPTRNHKVDLTAFGQFHDSCLHWLVSSDPSYSFYYLVLDLDNDSCTLDIAINFQINRNPALIGVNLLDYVIRDNGTAFNIVIPDPIYQLESNVEPELVIVTTIDGKLVYKGLDNSIYIPMPGMYLFKYWKRKPKLILVSY